jgi:hypothetical protein
MMNCLYDSPNEYGVNHAGRKTGRRFGAALFPYPV